MSKASLADTQAALNAVAGKKGFRCVPVSWEDAQRGTVGGTLSCWGGNISDVRLWEKGGQLLYTLRTENWNERLGYVSTKDVAVVVGNEVAGGSAPTPVTLESYLKNIGRYGAYAGIKSSDLYQAGVDGLATIRFQSVFLPIANDEVTEFCTEVYNYNTRSNDDPRNMTLLCTAQGTNAQQDGSGAQRVYLHAVDGDNAVHRYWMEAERSKHKVGGEQKETEEEAKEAAARGKATSIHIGTRAMGTRFNVQMLIQVPLQQKPKPTARSGNKGGSGFFSQFFGSSNTIKKKKCSSSPKCKSSQLSAAVDDVDECMGDDSIQSSCEEEDVNDMCSPPSAPPPPPCPPCPPPQPSAQCESLSAPSAMKMKKCDASESRSRRCAPEPPKKVIGTSNAARVSRGSEFDKWKGVSNKEPARDPSQHATITVTLYYTVAGGIPSEADIEMCVKDLDELYKACPSDKKLVDCGEVTAELTVKDMIDINTKITTQAYKPATFVPVKSAFPDLSMPADGTVARAESGNNRNGRQVTAFALRALDEEFLTGLHFKAAASTTKMSLMAAERKKEGGGGAETNNTNSMMDKRGGGHTGGGRGSPRVGAGASPYKTGGGQHRGPSRGRGSPSFKPKINSMYQIMSMSAGARDNNSKFRKVRDKERSSSRSESVGRAGGNNTSPNRPSKSSRTTTTAASRAPHHHHIDPVEDNQRVTTNLKGEGLMKTLTGSRAPAVSKGARSILKGNPTAGGTGGGSDDDDDNLSGGRQSPYGGASRRTSNASSIAVSALNTQGGLFGGGSRVKSTKSDMSRASSMGSVDRVQRGSSFGSSASRTVGGGDEDDVVAVTVDSEGSSTSSDTSRRKRRTSATPSPRSPITATKRPIPRSNPGPTTPAPMGSSRPVKLTEANIKAAQRRLKHQEASSKSRAAKGHGGENALLQKIVHSGTALPQDSKITRMSSYASTAMSSGASSRGSIGRPQRRPYRSLEEYLCEPVAERLFGYDSRKMRHRIQQKQIKELENLAIAECTFSPKLDSKSMSINTQSQSSLMKNARFRRQIMRSPPRSSQALRRSDSVMSAAWGNGSDFMGQVRPPSEYPESQMDTAGRRALKLTPKARKVDRNVSDLFTWEIERAEKLKEQQDKARRQQEDTALREEMEVYALREKRQESTLHRSGSNLSASAKSQRRSKSSRRADMEDDVNMMSSSMRGGSSLTPSALRSRNHNSNNRQSTTPKRISLMSPQSKKIIKRLGSDRITVQEYAEVESKIRTDTLKQIRDKARSSKDAWSVAEKLRQEKEQLLARQRKENERVHRQAARAALAQNSLTVDEDYRNAEAMLTLKKFSCGSTGDVDSYGTGSSAAQQVLSNTQGSQSLLSGGAAIPGATNCRGGGWGDSTASNNLPLRKVDSFVGSGPSSPNNNNNRSAMKGSTTTTYRSGGFSFSPAHGTSAEADLEACRERLASIAEEKRHIAELRRKVETNPGFSWWWMRLEEEKQAYRQPTTPPAPDDNNNGEQVLSSNSSHYNNNANLNNSTTVSDSFAGYYGGGGGDISGGNGGSFYNNNSSMYSSFPTNTSNLQQGSPYGSFAGNPSIMLPPGGPPPQQHLAPPGLTVHSPNASFAVGRTGSHRPVSFASNHMDASP